MIRVRYIVTCLFLQTGTHGLMFYMLFHWDMSIILLWCYILNKNNNNLDKWENACQSCLFWSCFISVLHRKQNTVLIKKPFRLESWMIFLQQKPKILVGDFKIMAKTQFRPIPLPPILNEHSLSWGRPCKDTYFWWPLYLSKPLDSYILTPWLLWCLHPG